MREGEAQVQGTAGFCMIMAGIQRDYFVRLSFHTRPQMRCTGGSAHVLLNGLERSRQKEAAGPMKDGSKDGPSWSLGVLRGGEGQIHFECNVV